MRNVPQKFKLKTVSLSAGARPIPESISEEFSKQSGGTCLSDRSSDSGPPLLIHSVQSGHAVTSYKEERRVSSSVSTYSSFSKEKAAEYNLVSDHSYAKVETGDGAEGDTQFSFVFWNVGGKKGFLSAFETSEINDDTLLSKDVVFLSETMSKEPFSSLKFKNFYSSGAVATEGRPSGGLELYYPGHIKGEELGSSAQHLVLKLENCFFRKMTLALPLCFGMSGEREGF